MGNFRIDYVLDYLRSMEFFWALLWVGVGIFAIDLLLLMETRWGQRNLLQKCLILSLLLHVLLVGYSRTLDLVVATPAAPSDPIEITVGDPPSVAKNGGGEGGDEGYGLGPNPRGSADKPWEAFTPGDVSQPERRDPERQKVASKIEVDRKNRFQPSELPGQAPLEHVPLAKVARPEPKPMQPAEPAPLIAAEKRAEPIAAPKAQRQEGRPMINIPSVAGPERPDTAVALGPGPVPKQATSPRDLPEALLQPPSTLARMTAGAATGSTTPQPPSALPGDSDYLPRSTQMARTNASPGSVGGSGSADGSEMGSPDGSSGVAGGSRRWTPGVSDLAARGGPGGGGGTGPRSLAGIPGEPAKPAPELYKLRTAPDRDQQAEARGATKETEAAVKAALKWLTESQAPDGRWVASSHEAGRESKVMGRDRQSAGAQADTGMTGLALLSLLASGHTHQKGEYRDNVRRGLEYLLRVQGRDGNLSGQGNVFEAMYCHAIATFAMSEALGMTGDARLQEPVRRAVGFTVAAQHSTSGGWRYQLGDPGDTSQLGWQYMALKSAELAGVPMPEATRQGVIKFLQSVSSGQHGGLASYRPNEEVTHSMTAEAIVCWQFLGMRRDHPAGREAGDYLLTQLPTAKNMNGYYWYYATLAMYQLQGTHWERWNESLRGALVATQRKTGPLAGSWDPDAVWGGHGGRVYNTALASLCLEVYYRFLPLYKQAGSAGGE